MPSLSAPRLQIILSALLMSTSGAVIKTCSSFSSWQVACFRAGIAATVLLLVVPGVIRSFNIRTLAVGAGNSRESGRPEGRSIRIDRLNRTAPSSPVIRSSRRDTLPVAVIPM